MTEHERGFDSGYSAAIHDARVEGSRARAEIQAVGFLRVFHVVAKHRGQVVWEYDVAAANEKAAEDLAREFVLTDPGVDLNVPCQFIAERARDLHEPYGWVIGVR